MSHPRVIEGTTEEIAALLQDGTGRKLRLIIDPEEDDFSDDFSAPPNAIRDPAHLEALLLEGIASEKDEVTDQEWEDIRKEVRKRLAQGKL